MAMVISSHTAVSALTYCDMAGDSLEAWKIQAEYKEKYFANDAYYLNGNITQEIMLSGMDQDFLVRVGLPKGYFASLDANYVFQNLAALYDYNTVQTITLLAGKRLDIGPGILLGIKFPLGTKLAGNPLLINRDDMYDIMAGLYQKGSLGPVKYSMQALMEQPIRQTYYQGYADLSASLGFNFYNVPEKQVIDILAEIHYSGILRGPQDVQIGPVFPEELQRIPGNSYMLTIIPQAVVTFYNDFSFVLGAEILVNADNWNLNKIGEPRYVIKANYVLNSSHRPAAVSGSGMPSSMTSTSTAGMPSSMTSTSTAGMPSNITSTSGTGLPSNITPTYGTK